ncbi:2Fe-2S iron-sulfur cluster-binding protein [Aporhodopirellula aestuarii]|uniref:2Fe-2S iron-sulfur cluster-binding protein n=1 Tax=Aporhodopirellula aestuarii TaxID=2950107 RepID=A0ABT0U8P4_9BACT|nr:2Fe-2S iron-sulfur cluster-binding protein [Aporhodopirellula aestuarii]MCM2372716.1 2Fe-2S iron-sulfur cluster-binding protein [Aporhodopirellula aestuarii]
MPKISIDERTIEVPAGTTVLDAAEQLGIEIPTLCFLKGYLPSTSCQVCLVRDRASGKLVPSCATKIVDGMQIDSETAEVHAARRTALELLLSDHVGDCLAPCFFACPAHMDIPLMLRQLGNHDLHDAIETIKRDIAIPAVLGRICTKPCEKGCRRSSADDPVSVCELKRYAADADLASEHAFAPECAADSGKRVAIIGAGPTGLSAAYYLRQRGHACRLIEATVQLGGRLRWETDSETLPRGTLDAEIAQIVGLDVQVETATPVDSREAFEKLVDSHDVVLIASGADAVKMSDEWSVDGSRRGIEINRETYQTKRENVFAAGCAVRGKCLFVRSAADGKEVAGCIDQFLSGQKVTAPPKPFASRLGRVATEEMKQFLAGAASVPVQTPNTSDDYSDEQVAEQSDRCLSCGCVAHGDCRLENYAARYGADPNRFGTRQGVYEVLGRGGNVLFEPGKCIKCELCIQIASQSQDALGLSFVGRGFDVRVSVPFDGSYDEGMGDLAERCIAACPTGALYFDRKAE